MDSVEEGDSVDSCIATLHFDVPKFKKPNYLQFSIAFIFNYKGSVLIEVAKLSPQWKSFSSLQRQELKLTTSGSHQKPENWRTHLLAEGHVVVRTRGTKYACLCHQESVFEVISRILMLVKIIGRSHKYLHFNTDLLNTSLLQVTKE